MNDREMKVISIRQPWAWLIIKGFKDIENRTWGTEIRGPVLIHASKTFDQEGYDFVKDFSPEIEMPAIDEFPKDGIVGGAVLTDCVQESESRWFQGPFGFVFQFPRESDFYPLKGQLGFFTFKG